MSEYRLFDAGNGTIQLLVALALIAFAPVLFGWASVLLSRLAKRRGGPRPARVPEPGTESARTKTWRAPCGELVRFPETKSDSGPRAA